MNVPMSSERKPWNRTCWKRYRRTRSRLLAKAPDALCSERLLPTTQTPDARQAHKHALRSDRRLGLLRAQAKTRLLRPRPSRTPRQTEFPPGWSRRVRTPPLARTPRRGRAHRIMNNGTCDLFFLSAPCSSIVWLSRCSLAAGSLSPKHRLASATTFFGVEHVINSGGHYTTVLSRGVTF
jgi:hypothetical protein